MSPEWQVAIAVASIFSGLGISMCTLTYMLGKKHERNDSVQQEVRSLRAEFTQRDRAMELLVNYDKLRDRDNG